MICFPIVFVYVRFVKPLAFNHHLACYPGRSQSYRRVSYPPSIGEIYTLVVACCGIKIDALATCTGTRLLHGYLSLPCSPSRLRLRAVSLLRRESKAYQRPRFSWSAMHFDSCGAGHVDMENPYVPLCCTRCQPSPPDIAAQVPAECTCRLTS